MYMRGKFFVPFLLIAVMLLSSCTQIINSAADELRMFSWEGTADNGNTASLLFCDNKASLSLQTHDGLLRIHGLCLVDDEKLMICDEGSGMNYSFGYTLYGDRVELTATNGTLTLNKVSLSDDTAAASSR